MIVNTVLKYGQSIKPEVLAGVSKVGELRVYSSNSYKKDKLDRGNISNNWISAINYRPKADYFIGMDSDIVINFNAVDRLLSNMSGYGFRFVGIDHKNTHGVWCVSEKAVKSVPFEVITHECPVCNWRKRIYKAGFGVGKITDIMVGHIER